MLLINYTKRKAYSASLNSGAESGEAQDHSEKAPGAGCENPRIVLHMRGLMQALYYITYTLFALRNTS